MKHYTYTTQGTCAKVIEFDLNDEGKICNLVFHGGCPGNLKAISRLCEGQDASKVQELLSGNTCGMKSTSCADQLSKAISEALVNN